MKYMHRRQAGGERPTPLHVHHACTQVHAAHMQWSLPFCPHAARCVCVGGGARNTCLRLPHSHSLQRTGACIRLRCAEVGHLVVYAAEVRWRSEPMMCAPHDVRAACRTSTQYCTAKPVWNEEIWLEQVPPGANLEFQVRPVPGSGQRGHSAARCCLF